jgi:ATP-dependent Clp protease adapter protein ClpS
MRGVMGADHMATKQDHMEQTDTPIQTNDSSGGAAIAVKSRPAPPKIDRLPPWKVLLHNDEVNEFGYVIESIVELTTLNPQQALLRTIEAHKTGLSLLISTHREYAELLHEQFASKRLKVTIEPER